MLRQVPFLVALAVFVTSPAQAQGHTMHHHPRGAKIIMIGTVVDPMCAFVQQAADTAQARCADQQRDTTLPPIDRKSTRLNSSHTVISYAVFCLKKKKKTQ